MIRVQRTRSALFVLDRALELTRRQPPRELARAALPGLCIAWLVVSLYALERVEGIRSLRPVFAVALVAACLFRNLTLSQWSGRRVADMLSEDEPPRAAFSLKLGAALWMGFSLWISLWPVVAALRLEIWLLAATIPLFCLRKALAPSFLPAFDRSLEPSATCSLKAAIRHAAGRRAQAMLCEFFLICGAIGLTFNLGASLVLSLSLAQQSFGLELTLLQAFLSPDNEFGLLCLACLVWALFEPLRASVAAVLFAETESALSGLELRRMVERALTRTKGPVLPLLCCAALSLTLPYSADAQVPAPSLPGAHMETTPCEPECEALRQRDAFWTERVHFILRSPAFLEFPDEPWARREPQRSPSSTLDGYLRQLAGTTEDDSAHEAPTWLPPLVTFALLFLGAFLALSLMRLAFRRSFLATSTPAARPTRTEPAAQASALEVLCAALEQLEQKPAQALSLLYLAALLGLAERDLVTFSRAHTAGAYLRQLSLHAEGALLSELTQRFEAIFYGDSAIAPHELARCAELAQRLVRGLPP